MFPVAEFLKPITWTSLQDVDAHRRIIFEAIVKYRKMKNQGVVAVFKRDRFDRYSNFARIGDGSLGGKGRGLAFIDNMVKRYPEFESSKMHGWQFLRQWYCVPMSSTSLWRPIIFIKSLYRMPTMMRFYDIS